MSDSRHQRLEDAILDEAFPDVDMALRRGRHIDRDDAEWYPFILDAQDYLEAFYKRYGCDLVHRAEGYFYLLPTSERMGRRHMSPAEMVVGQALTLLYLDPSTVQGGGVVTREQVLGHLAGVMGSDALVAMMNRSTARRTKKQDPRVAEENARAKVAEAIRRLAGLGFIEIVTDGGLRLRPALMRFAEPVRGSAEPEAALERLVAAGEVVLTDPDGPGAEVADGDEPDAAEAALEATDAVEVAEDADAQEAGEAANLQEETPDAPQTTPPELGPLTEPAPPGDFQPEPPPLGEDLDDGGSFFEDDGLEDPR